MNGTKQSDRDISSHEGGEQGETSGVAGAKVPTQGDAGRSDLWPYTEMDQWGYGINRLRQPCRYARRCDPREEPDASARMSESVRGLGVIRIPTALTG